MNVEVQVNPSLIVNSVSGSAAGEDMVNITIISGSSTVMLQANGYDLITAINCCLMDGKNE